jgi:hypothetical protein
LDWVGAAVSEASPYALWVSGNWADVMSGHWYCACVAVSHLTWTCPSSYRSALDAKQNGHSLPTASLSVLFILKTPRAHILGGRLIAHSSTQMWPGHPVPLPWHTQSTREDCLHTGNLESPARR